MAQGNDESAPWEDDPQEDDYKRSLVEKIRSGQEDFTFGPGSPDPTQEDLGTYVGGRHSPASGFAVEKGVALAPSDYYSFTPQQRLSLGIMDIAPEDQKGKIERYYGAGSSRSKKRESDSPPWNEDVPTSTTERPPWEDHGDPEGTPAVEIEHTPVTSQSPDQPRKGWAERSRDWFTNTFAIPGVTAKIPLEGEPVQLGSVPGLTEPLYNPQRMEAGDDVPDIEPATGRMLKTTHKASAPEAAFTNVARSFISGVTSAKGLVEMYPPFFLAEVLYNSPDIWKRVQEAEKTPAWSQERWEAGFDVVLTLGTLGLMGHALFKPKPEVKGGDIHAEKPDTAAGAVPTKQGVAPVQEAEGKIQTGDPRDALAKEQEKPVSETARVARDLSPEQQALVDQFNREQEQKEAQQMGGPGTPGAGEIPPPRVTGIKNALIDEERMKRGWLPLMRPARQAHGVIWDKAMDILERNDRAGSEMVDAIRDGTKTAISETDDAVMAHEHIRVTNERDMEGERASDPHLSEADKDEARLRWSALEDRVNEIQQAMRQSGTFQGRAFRFRQALIADDYTLAGMEKKARALKGEGLSPEESAEIAKTAGQIRDLDEKILTNTKKIRDTAATEKGETTVKRIRKRVKKKTPEDAETDRADILSGIKEHLDNGGELMELKPLLRKLGEYYMRKGVDKLQPLARVLHAEVKNIIPDITEEQVRDIYAGYGDYSPPSTDAIKLMQADITGQLQQAGKIRDMFDKLPPKKSGKGRPTMSAKERALVKKVNEVKKKGGFQITDKATQLKTTMEGIKTRLRNQIIDMTREITSGERPPGKEGIEWDIDTQKMAGLRDRIRDTLRAITPKEVTDSQRIKQLINAANNNLEYWQDRLALAKKGVFKLSRETGKNLTTPELEAIKARIEEAKAHVQELYDARNPKKTPEQVAMARYQSNLWRQMIDLTDRMARGDYGPKVKKEQYLDEETRAVVEQRDRIKQKFDQEQLRKRRDERPLWLKAVEGLPKWVRTGVLSWPTVFVHLSSASWWLNVFTPIEELSRTVTRYGLKAVGLGKIPEYAPRYGRGFHVQTEVGAIVNTFRHLIDEPWKVIKTGKSTQDILYGSERVVPRELKDFLTYLHKAFKENVRQNEFFRSWETRMNWAAKHGVDVTEPINQMKTMVDSLNELQKHKVGELSLRDANNQIFNEDNSVADFINAGFGRLRQIASKRGERQFSAAALGALGRSKTPILRIPLNIIKRNFEYQFGTVTGGVRVAAALIKGLDKMTPAEMDVIMRNLSRGNVGIAMLAYGYFHPEQFGGFYQHGEKREKDDVPVGAMRLFGHDVPHSVLASPALFNFQIGSTIRRVLDSRLSKKDREGPGYANAIVAAEAGLLENTPVVRLMEDNIKALDPRERDQFIGGLMQTPIPGVVVWSARYMDKDAQGNLIPRKPATALDYAKENIPGLRQQVPEKIPKSTTGGGRKKLIQDLMPSRRSRKSSFQHQLMSP